MSTLTFSATLGGAINIIGPNTTSTLNLTLPTADGSAGQALTTNGSGTLAFGTVPLTTGVTGTLPVANGGTGLTSPGSNGSVLTSNGSAWVSVPFTNSGGFSHMQVFTSSGTFTAPSTGTFKVTIVGGGGGGGRGTDGSGGGNGGGGGGTAIKYYSGISSGTSCTVTIGANGTGSTTQATAGTDGGASSFVVPGNTTLTSNGGIGGKYYPSGSNTWGLGGTATGGDANIQGGAGMVGAQKPTGVNVAGGTGGGSLLGFGGVSPNGAELPFSATGYGAGGAGGGTSSLSTSGTNGAAGICIVEY